MSVFAGLFLFAVVGYIARAAWSVLAQDAKAEREWRQRMRQLRDEGSRP